MPVSCCLLPFAKRIAGRDANAVRKEWHKLPTGCMDPQCSPGGCRANCRDYAAGAVVKINNAPKQTMPPKIEEKGK